MEATGKEASPQTMLLEMGRPSVTARMVRNRLRKEQIQKDEGQNVASRAEEESGIEEDMFGDEALPAFDENRGVQRCTYTSVEAAEEACRSAFSESCSYACCCCERKLFRQSVVEVTENMHDTLNEEWATNLAGWVTRRGVGYICHTCLGSIHRDRCPRFSLDNGLELPEVPPELQGIPELAERLVAIRIPFLQLRRLPTGNQHGLKGVDSIASPVRFPFLRKPSHRPVLPTPSFLLPYHPSLSFHHRPCSCIPIPSPAHALPQFPCLYRSLPATPLAKPSRPHPCASIPLPLLP
ncbi:hypothetical protein Agub_g4169 [Astrephomene gubernaculifera]|uniref:DUF6570 domain-containing protein n=1 Tax=Astrephomene gubernaculifera TaxID=47775 RepID=A0AAD3HJR4_9CHLO|nr:hypothetical protein Agub_g4169 [Astrephomene gubernaculifera]